METYNVQYNATMAEYGRRSSSPKIASVHIVFRKFPRDIDCSMSISPARMQCRIPQRLGSPRPRLTRTTKPINPQVSRSRSTNRSDANSGKQIIVPRIVRPERVARVPLPAKKVPVHKKPFNSYVTKVRIASCQKFQRQQKQGPVELPDQETIKKREELELQDGYQDEEELNEVIKIKSSWTKRLTQFEKLKSDLENLQKNIMESYASLRNTHKAMSALGQIVNLPPADDLRIMNVAKLSPDKLLQLCADSKFPDVAAQKDSMNTTIDMNKLFEMPAKLVATCEQTLHKRKEIIDWFQSLKSEERGISMNKLNKKINEFNAENEMLTCSMNSCKADFLKELNDIVDFMRKSVNQTIALQVRTEELMYEVSELNTQNADLRKQLQTTEQFKLVHNKHRVQELEKELKEERCKKIVIKERLTRAEGQVKIGNERAAQLESALELTRSQNWTLERTVQQLNDQNQRLQMDFDKELSKLTDSIRGNTVHLQEIAEAREKLQTEKEALENRLQELSDSYNESLVKMKEELCANVTKVKETEEKFEKEKDERKKLELNLECLCAKVLESEMRYKDSLKKLQEKDDELSKLAMAKCELDTTKQNLETVTNDLEDHKNRMQMQAETIHEIERNFNETVNLERSLKADIRNKEKYIAELEKNRSLLEQQLHESEHKMESYENQLMSLKSQIAQVHEEFGEFENMNQLHDMINQQRDKLLETTRQNGDLANALQQKETELLEHLAEQEQLLEQRDGIIKMLSEKEEEHANIVKLLRNNLEMRAQADSDLTQQLAERSAEIDSLISSLETRKQQISQLEKIILTLEEQLRKVHLQRRKDQDKMLMLEKAITDYEAFPADIKQSIETPVDNIDKLIKLLEQELSPSLDPKHVEPPLSNKNNERKKCDRIENCAEGNNANLIYQVEENKVIPKPILGNPKKKLDRDNLDRKKAIMNMETQKWLPNPEPIHVYTSSVEKKLPPFKGMVPVVQVMASQRDDKKCKMFKLAGHNL